MVYIYAEVDRFREILTVHRFGEMLIAYLFTISGTIFSKLISYCCRSISFYIGNLFDCYFPMQC